MNEKQESIIRQQTVLMILRNQGKEYVNQRIVKRFLRCIGKSTSLVLKLSSYPK